VSALIVGSFVPFTRLGVRLAFACHPERSEESQLIHASAHTLARLRSGSMVNQAFGLPASPS